MELQAKDNKNLKVKLIEIYETTFKGKVLTESGGWKPGEICDTFAVGSFEVVIPLKKHLDNMERLYKYINAVKPL
jgi:hypothetical protein